MCECASVRAPLPSRVRYNSGRSSAGRPLQQRIKSGNERRINSAKHLLSSLCLVKQSDGSKRQKKTERKSNMTMNTPHRILSLHLLQHIVCCRAPPNWQQISKEIFIGSLMLSFREALIISRSKQMHLNIERVQEVKQKRDRFRCFNCLLGPSHSNRRFVSVSTHNANSRKLDLPY